MDPRRWAAIERLYHAASARAGEERAAYLAEACGGDAALRRDVEALLAAPTTVDGVFGAPAVAGMRAPTGATDPLPLTGRRVGVYELRDRIGAGGMDI